MIIDAHTHLFPDAMAERVLQKLVENTRPFVSVFGETKPHTDATVAGLTVSQRAAGIDLSLVLPIATSPKSSPTLNDFAARVDALPGLRSFGSVHPRNPGFREELDRIVSLGLRGIKLHPEYQDCFADAPETIAVAREAADRGLWIVLHAGADIGMAPPIHCTPERALRLREAVPHARIILAHMGGYRLWDEVERLLPGSGFYLDTSFCLPNHPDKHEQFARIIRKIGADHGLFGSDSPWTGQEESLQAAYRLFDAYGFTEAEQTAILGGNAAAILEETR